MRAANLNVRELTVGWQMNEEKPENTQRPCWLCLKDLSASCLPAGEHLSHPLMMPPLISDRRKDPQTLPRLGRSLAKVTARC